jgi:hypothetical protein
MLATPLGKFRFRLRSPLNELFSSHLLFSTPFSTPEKEGGNYDNRQAADIKHHHNQRHLTDDTFESKPLYSKS